MKNGKPDSKEKMPIIEPTEYEINRDDLAINAKVKAHIESLGCTYKWMNEKEVLKRQGRHKNGYQIFVVPTEMRGDIGHFGCSNEGFIRYGDLILGVKPLQGVALHAARLKQHTVAQLEGIKGKAKQRNAEARAAGVKILDEDF